MMVRGRRGLLIPILISMAAIALMQFVAANTVGYHDVWSDLLWMAAYFFGGTIVAILFFNLDGPSRGDISAINARSHHAED